MATIQTDAKGSPVLTSIPKRSAAMEEHGIESGLPPERKLLVWSSFKRLEECALQVLHELEENQEHGNQFILVLGLPEHARNRFDDDPRPLRGVNFRFEWDGTTGVIKVLPSVSHNIATSKLRDKISHQFWQMGISDDDMAWGMATTHRPPGSNRGKEPDECFWPRTRLPTGGQVVAWPTLVIETGVSESLPRLRRDAHWWLDNSNGQVRIVLVVSVRGSHKRLILEKWQLAPPNSPNPLTGAAILQLQQQVPPPMPPLVPQPPATRQPFALQELEIEPIGVTGGPLVLPFEALYDRAPQGNEADIILNAQMLIQCIRHL